MDNTIKSCNIPLIFSTIFVTSKTKKSENKFSYDFSEQILNSPFTLLINNGFAVVKVC